MRAKLWVCGAMAALALAGCGRKASTDVAAGAGLGGIGGSAPTSPSSSSAGVGDAGSDAVGQKLDDYITGYNALVGTFGLRQQFAQYQGQQIARKGVNDPVFVNVGWIDNGLTSLEKARREPGRAPELDAAGDRMLAVLGPLVAQVKGLSTYYTSRGPLADGFARGKREDPQVTARYQAALAALPALSDAIDALQDRRDQAQLQALKSAGDAVGYDHALAMLKAKQLMALAASPADLADPAKQARGDQLMAQIQAALADEAKAHAASANSVEHGARDSMYDSAAERLQGMIGAYRTLRQTPTPIAHQMLVSAYNGAVQQSNFSP